ncbi:helix-turn-helix domain-containing protein [Sphingomonas sp. CFBP 8760]|uniref:helix-turn-helix domain-containing protein n=1 Tax=Sphingomonas sp. CFBP 8760 TaxID=2775282 RepID=UPI00177A97EE|nr:AraC family transcriptional regulator [Sphingomonas sp. CFBP 8760]MBD8548810.1 helix-turn-helix transcriptional regulator [Sphingomonas sp. CFBP 8760]
MKRTLDQLLTTIDVDPHAFSVCRIQTGWRMTFPAFAAVTVHFVLRGSGHLQVGASPPIPFSPSSVLIVPTSEQHWVGEVGDNAEVSEAANRCALLGDGLVEFTAGSGAHDTLMLCGALSAPYQGGLGFFDLLRVPTAGDMAAGIIPAGVFDAMADEITHAGFGTQAMCQALMKQGLIALLRDRRERQTELSGGAMSHPRLSKALAAIIGDPAAPHTVDSLASLSGMSRASFSDHFSKTFGQGPIDFVQKARLRIAARLLRTTDLPIKVIAQAAGYAGPRPFSRAFQAAYDCGPADYRARPDSENIRALS